MRAAERRRRASELGEVGTAGLRPGDTRSPGQLFPQHRFLPLWERPCSEPTGPSPNPTASNPQPYHSPGLLTPQLRLNATAMLTPGAAAQPKPRRDAGRPGRVEVTSGPAQQEDGAWPALGEPPGDAGSGGRAGAEGRAARARASSAGAGVVLGRCAVRAAVGTRPRKDAGALGSRGGPRRAWRP